MLQEDLSQQSVISVGATVTSSGWVSVYFQWSYAELPV